MMHHCQRPEILPVNEWSRKVELEGLFIIHPLLNVHAYKVFHEVVGRVKKDQPGKWEYYFFPLCKTLEFPYKKNLVHKHLLNADGMVEIFTFVYRISVVVRLEKASAVQKHLEVQAPT